MQTIHRIITGDAEELSELAHQSIDLVVTSPPYPMIQMWDGLFSAFDPAVESALADADGDLAFNLMHRKLDRIWQALPRVLKPGGVVCINIGDATRTIGGCFQLFANHARIISAFRTMGFSQLPAIIWRKPTNAPTKFMGSGMLPPGAYVTLEHEYVLIFRMQGKRFFDSPDKKDARRRSAYFWEERNEWFSDVWMNLRGVSQGLTALAGRERTGAFPLELPYRLMNMFSLKNDTVLDPFLGTGTTMQAAMCCARNCIGYEVDPSFTRLALESAVKTPEIARQLLTDRLEAHTRFIQDRSKGKGAAKYRNRHYHFPVVTKQEEDLQLDRLSHVHFMGNQSYQVFYEEDRLPSAISNDGRPGTGAIPGPTRFPGNRQLKIS